MPDDSTAPAIMSIVPGVRWPAIPSARASQMLAIQFQLDRSQWWTPAELAQWQAGQMAALLQHAHRTVPFYRQRLIEAGATIDKGSGSLAWSRIPLLTRADIQQAGTDLHCTEGPKEHGPLSTTTTSGSSGRPVTTMGTTVTRLFSNAILLRQHLWHRRQFHLKLAGIRTRKRTPDAPRETSADNWGGGTLDIVRTGPAVGLDVAASVDEQADFLLRHDPDYLNTYPSVVLALADYFSKSDRRLTRLREVRTFGEVLEPKVRKACRDVWGVPVVDTYSTEEMGAIALQCPDHEHYHVQSESVLVEVLDDRGQACRAGETGRVVVTSLHNFAMPLIRYDIGDYAEVGEQCPCGRGLPVLKRILGRQRNMFLLPDGRRVWPNLQVSEDEVATMPPVQQFQVIQRALDRIDLLVVAPRTFTEAEEMFLRRLIARALDCELAVEIKYVEAIPRGETGKYEDFRSEVSS